MEQRGTIAVVDPGEGERGGSRWRGLGFVVGNVCLGLGWDDSYFFLSVFNMFLIIKIVSYCKKV